MFILEEYKNLIKNCNKENVFVARVNWTIINIYPIEFGLIEQNLHSQWLMLRHGNVHLFYFCVAFH